MQKSRHHFGMPTRDFLYTLDQIAMMVALDEDKLKANHIHFYLKSPGARPHGKIMARNISPAGVQPEWRVSENEFLRWLRFMGFRVMERTNLIS